MAAKTRYFTLDGSTNRGRFTVAANRSERVEASQLSTSSTTGVNVRLEVFRSPTTYQLAHDVFVPVEKIVEPLFRGITFEAGDIITVVFVAGSSTSATWFAITTDEQVV